MTLVERKTILTENLCEFSKKQTIASKQKELTVLELAKLYCEIYADADDILAALRELDIELSASDEMVFFSELCHSDLTPKIKEQLFIGSSEPTLAGAHSKISYLKNKYNDMAFEYFSRSVANAKPDYASSFTECCENVFDGRCEFCIIPIMNSSDGRLMSFYSLLDRYELKICETVDFDADGTASSIRYARVSRACKEQKERVQKNKRFIFEFSVIDEGMTIFAPLFEAANKASARLIAVDSLPVEYTSHMQKFYFSFSIPQSSALAFRLFVALKHPTYTPIGFYKETE